MACHHDSSVTCVECARWQHYPYGYYPYPSAYAVATTNNLTPGPFKCTDCGCWWAGWYHLCAQARANHERAAFTEARANHERAALTPQEGTDNG